MQLVHQRIAADVVKPQQKMTNNNRVVLSLIVPAFNESEVLQKFHLEVNRVLAKSISIKTEIIYINDGSTDDTWHVLNQLPASHADIQLVNLSRNFGKEAAMTAGLDWAKGDAVILLDADMQDPPSLIPDMIAAWQAGYDIVNMKRDTRQGESWFKVFSARLYYKLLDRLSDSPVERNVGDFRLLSRNVVDSIKQLSERNRYMKGIMSWPGFRQTTLSFDRPERAAGTTKWNFFQLIQLGISGITSFSSKPLRMATWVGVLISTGALLYSLFVLIKTLLIGDTAAGYPSLMIVQLWLGGVQLIAIGLLSEYTGKIFTEVKNRPIYFVMDDTRTDCDIQEVTHDAQQGNPANNQQDTERTNENRVMHNIRHGVNHG